MATLGEVLSEIFAPRIEQPSYLGGSAQEPLSIPVQEDAPGSNGMAPIKATPDGAFIDALRRTFMPTPQPPDGMDARTYAPGDPSLARSAMPSEQPQPQTWPDPPHYRPDTDAGYAPQRGFVADADNDPARAAQMVPSVDRSGPTPRPGAARPTAGPGYSPEGPGDMPLRRAAPPAAAAPANSEIARAFRAFFQGAAGVNPTSPKFSAFAQGASGAMKSQYDERQKEALLARQQSKDALDETLRLSKHDRDEALADNLMQYRKRKSGADGELPYAVIGKHNELKNNVARDYKRALDLINKDYSLGPAEKKKAQEEARLERDSRLSEIEQQYKQRSLTPDMGKAPQKKEAKPPQQSGDGKSPQAPIMTTDPKVIQGLQKGDYYINPADGQVYQKN